MSKVKTRDISVTQYAELRKISRSAVNQAILNNHKMPGVESVVKIGSTYVLKVNESFFQEIFQYIKN